MLSTVLGYQVSLWYLNCEFCGLSYCSLLYCGIFLTLFSIFKVILLVITLLDALSGFGALQLTWLLPSFLCHISIVHFDVLNRRQHVIDCLIFQPWLPMCPIVPYVYTLFNKIWILHSHRLNLNLEFHFWSTKRLKCNIKLYIHIFDCMLLFYVCVTNVIW